MIIPTDPVAQCRSDWESDNVATTISSVIMLERMDPFEEGMEVDTLLRAPDSTVLTKDLLAIVFGEPG